MSRQATTVSDWPDTADFIARAEEMQQRIAGRASACEKMRSIPAETMEELRDAGFFRLLQPRRWGGFEVNPIALFEVQMRLAEVCMSTAWVLGVVAVHNWQLALFAEEAQSDVWGDDEATLISSSYAPVGKVKHTDGGFRLSGRWRFSSGCEHCKWVLLGAVVPSARGEHGENEAQLRTFLVPRDDYEIVDTWNTMGLRGTGSHDIVVRNAFVPEHRTHKNLDGFRTRSPGNAKNDGPLYRLPFGQLFVRAVSSASIGALRGALRTHEERTRDRISSFGSAPSRNPTVLRNIAKARAEVDAMELILRRNFEVMMKTVERNEEIALDDRLRYRYQSSDVARRCTELVSDLFVSAGAGVVFDGNPLQRAFLDVYASRLHVANDPEACATNWGGVTLGADNQDFFI